MTSTLKWTYQFSMVLPFYEAPNFFWHQNLDDVIKCTCGFWCCLFTNISFENGILILSFSINQGNDSSIGCWAKQIIQMILQIWWRYNYSRSWIYRSTINGCLISNSCTGCKGIMGFIWTNNLLIDTSVFTRRGTHIHTCLYTYKFTL